MSYLQDQAAYKQARDQEERNFYRQQQDQMTGTDSDGGWHATAGSRFSDDTTARGRPRKYPNRGQSLRYGRAANDQELSEFMRQQGAPSMTRGVNKGLVSKKVENSRKRQVAGAAGRKAFSDAKTEIQKFFEAAEGKIEEANNANKARRDDIMKRLDAKYNRVMGRIDNFGHAARADLQERAAESLGNIQANLSARGLGNSTIMASFIQRNQRDLAREQQRLSEMVDTRAMNADMQMTDNQTGFLERINENAPDYGQLMELALKYGQGGGGGQQGQQGGGPQIDPNMAPGTTRTVQNADGTAQTFIGQQMQQQGGGLPPGAVGAGRNRGPIWAGDMGVGNFLQGIRNSQAPNGQYGAYNYNSGGVEGSQRPKQVWEPGATDVPNQGPRQYADGATDLNMPYGPENAPDPVWPEGATDMKMPYGPKNAPTAPGRAGFGIPEPWKDPNPNFDTEGFEGITAGDVMDWNSNDYYKGYSPPSYRMPDYKFGDSTRPQPRHNNNFMYYEGGQADSGEFSYANQEDTYTGPSGGWGYPNAPRNAPSSANALPRPEGFVPIQLRQAPQPQQRGYGFYSNGRSF